MATTSTAGSSKRPRGDENDGPVVAAPAPLQQRRNRGAGGRTVIFTNATAARAFLHQFKLPFERSTEANVVCLDGGAYLLPDKHRTQFFECIASDVDSGAWMGNTFVERHGEDFPLHLDIDYSGGAEYAFHGFRERMLPVLLEVAHEMFEPALIAAAATDTDNTKTRICAAVAHAPYGEATPEPGTVKTGIHVVFGFLGSAGNTKLRPLLVESAVALEFRARLIEVLTRVFGPDSRKCFEPGRNAAALGWDEVVDASVLLPGKGLRTLWSAKVADCASCMKFRGCGEKSFHAMRRCAMSKKCEPCDFAMLARNHDRLTHIPRCTMAGKTYVSRMYVPDGLFARGSTKASVSRIWMASSIAVDEWLRVFTVSIGSLVTPPPVVRMADIMAGEGTEEGGVGVKKAPLSRGTFAKVSWPMMYRAKAQSPLEKAIGAWIESDPNFSAENDKPYPCRPTIASVNASLMTTKVFIRLKDTYCVVQKRYHKSNSAFIMVDHNNSASFGCYDTSCRSKFGEPFPGPVIFDPESGKLLYSYV